MTEKELRQVAELLKLPRRNHDGSITILSSRGSPITMKNMGARVLSPFESRQVWILRNQRMRDDTH